MTENAHALTHPLKLCCNSKLLICKRKKIHVWICSDRVYLELWLNLVKNTQMLILGHFGPLLTHGRLDLLPELGLSPNPNQYSKINLIPISDTHGSFCSKHISWKIVKIFATQKDFFKFYKSREADCVFNTRIKFFTKKSSCTFFIKSFV